MKWAKNWKPVLIIGIICGIGVSSKWQGFLLFISVIFSRTIQNIENVLNSVIYSESFLFFGYDTILFTINIMIIHLNVEYFTQYYKHNILNDITYHCKCYRNTLMVCNIIICISTPPRLVLEFWEGAGMLNRVIYYSV